MKATTTVFAQMIKLLPRQLLEEIAGKFFKPGNATNVAIWDQLVALIFCDISGLDSCAKSKMAYIPLWGLFSTPEALSP